MRPERFAGGLLLAPVAALMLAAAPDPAAAGPPFTPPGLANKGGFPPGAQKFGHGGFCPPGLRDKGCVPPGLHSFGRGDIIPDHVRYRRIHHRDYDLPRPGPGRFYGAIGGDVYLIAEATQRVIEAISILDAMGR